MYRKDDLPSMSLGERAQERRKLCDMDLIHALDGVIDNELSHWLQQSGPFNDPGPCPGNVPVKFVAQGGFAVDVGRLQPQVSWQELPS